ncbi:MAG: nitrate- and nitrite sensing domain-containing protein [Acidobacteria bacterium]|nr:nitrate- and nitrite sensing domain-containing protein [Acidobacteriota bacterium]
MRRLLNRLSLQRRLEALVAVSTLMALAFGGLVLRDAWQAASEASAVTGLARLAVATSAAVHELQKERGRSSGYLGSHGQQFGTELDEQRRQSDAALAALDTAMKAADPSADVREQLGRASTRRQGLASMRARVQAAEIPAPEAIDYYAAVIGDYLAAVDAMALVPREGDVTRQLVAYGNFLQAKESAGLERAVLSNVFSADRFTPALYRTFAGVVAREQTRLSLFRTHANPQDASLLERTVSGADVTHVMDWRTLAFERADRGGFGVNSADWFSGATARIDLMKKVEDRLSTGIVANAEARLRSAEHMMALVVGLGLVTLVLGVGGALVIGRTTSTAIAHVATELTESAEQVAAAARQVSASAQSLAQGATEQAASIEETSASMEEMGSMTHKNSEHAREAAQLVASMSEHVGRSNAALEHMVVSMQAITDSSARVGAIIKTIDEIAFQTNILALNAAVEAARAGEAGLGFAVVADEVRSLAQRASAAARDTASMIEESIARSREGSVRVSEVTDAIEAITRSVSAVEGIVSDVREASAQQTTGIDQVSTALTQMEQVTQGTAATAEQSAAASEELHAQAEASIAVVRELHDIVHGAQDGSTPSAPAATRRRGAPTGERGRPRVVSLQARRGAPETRGIAVAR